MNEMNKILEKSVLALKRDYRLKFCITRCAVMYTVLTIQERVIFGSKQVSSFTILVSSTLLTVAAIASLPWLRPICVFNVLLVLHNWLQRGQDTKLSKWVSIWWRILVLSLYFRLQTSQHHNIPSPLAPISLLIFSWICSSRSMFKSEIRVQ